MAALAASVWALGAAAPDEAAETVRAVPVESDAPPPQPPVLADELDVGDPASERAHAYAVLGETEVVEAAAAYPGDPLTQIADAGRRGAGARSFTLTVPEANGGVRLVARMPTAGGLRAARVEVDGASVDDQPWIVPPVTMPGGWLDAAFDLPAALTRGKTQVRVTVRPVVHRPEEPSAPWSVHQYWAYALPGEAEADLLIGHWTGTWHSAGRNTSGRLSCTISRAGEGTYRADFKAIVWRLFPFRIAVDLAAEAAPAPTGSTRWEFGGDKDLGALAGGLYRFRGWTDGAVFVSTYTAESDRGTYRLRRTETTVDE